MDNLLVYLVVLLMVWPVIKKFKWKRYDRRKYEEYMHSSAWRKKRAEIIKRDKKCRKCGRKGHLHVHHLTYKRLGNEKDSDLITLCSECHKKVHKKRKY